MPYYRLCFAKDGRAGCFDEFQARDDAAAMREAAQHLDAGHADLWCGERHVARLRAGGPAPPAAAGDSGPIPDLGRPAQAC